MARRRTVAPSPLTPDAEGVPPELLVGRLLEVWADRGAESPAWSASRRWSDARAAWLAERGLTHGQGHIDWHKVKAQHGSALLDHAPWSIRFLDDEGRGGYVDARLARAGVTRADVPGLRRAALERLP